MKKSVLRHTVWVLFVAILAITNSASAIDDAAKRAGAAEAYDRGTAAYLAGRYSEAGQWFETAYRLVPAYASLAQSVRAYKQAGDTLNAANLALRIEASYADQQGAADLAKPLITEASERFARVDLVCKDCSVSINGKLLDYSSIFVEPGSQSAFTFEFPTGPRKVEFTGKAGERRELSAEAPPPQALASSGQHSSASDHVDRAPKNKLKVLPPWAIYTSAGVTLALGGLALWSGLNAKAGVSDYQANPTQEKLDAGQAKEQRTNILIGATIGAAVITGVAAAFFTDWHPTEKKIGAVHATPTLTSQQVGMMVSGSF